MDAALVEKTCPLGVVAEIAEPRFMPVVGPNRAHKPLRRVRDLTRDFLEGLGRLDGPRPPLPPGGKFLSLPWRGVPERRRDAGAFRWESRTGLEYSEGFLIAPGARWCSPAIDSSADTRVRFEALSPAGGHPQLSLEWAAENAHSSLATLKLLPPETLAFVRQTDLLLPPGRGSVCFEARDDAAFVGEARILSPEAPGSDARPRWLVLGVEDTLRADVLDRKLGEPVCPELARLAQRGLVFSRAMSGGCHTYAALFPLLTGRDLTRIDPLASRMSRDESESSLSALLARANLPISLLAEEAGYHAVFLGNNAFINPYPLFSRFSGHTRTTSGTVESARRLGELTGRYADERIFFLHWISAPHGNSAAPRRLIDALGCAGIRDLSRCSCVYAARARHGDEALAALERALEDAGVGASSLQIVTADHGELLADEMRSWMERGGAAAVPKVHHGATCNPKEVTVPLVVSGPGIRPGRSDALVSTLDIAPTLTSILGLPAVYELDGRPLPLGGPVGVESHRRVVSHGFCVESVVQDFLQFLWWRLDCGESQRAGDRSAENSAEIWEGGRPRAKTDQTALARLLDQHRRWTVERLPAEALFVDPSGAGRLSVRVIATGGRVTDFGPSGPVGGLARITRAVLLPDSRGVEVTFDDYPGLFYVATEPPLSPVRIETVQAVPRPLVFVGRWQLPMDVLGRDLAPASAKDYFVAAAEPERRASADRNLRIWWQPASVSRDKEQPGLLIELNRVLREWGYVR
jgi:hypothetical protein